MNEKDLKKQMEQELELEELHKQLGIVDDPEIPVDDEDDEAALFAKWKAEQMAKKKAKQQEVQELPSFRSNLQEMNIHEEKEPIVEEVKETPKKKSTAKKVAKKEEVPKKKEPELSAEEQLDARNKIAKEKLANIEINVDEIEIVEQPRGLSKIDDYNISLNMGATPSPTYQVVCNQSCYIANMKAIKYGDAIAIANSSSSAFQERSRIYRLLYDKCDSFSVGKISFDEFLRITSFYDAETLMFGIYQQSFPGTTEFQVQCGSCGMQHNMTFQNEEFITVKDDEVYKNIQDTIASCSNPEQAIANSIVNKTTRKILPDSKIAIDIAIPSLKDNLDLLGRVNPKLLEANKEVISLMMFIKNIYMLDVNKTISTGKPCYYKMDKDLSSVSRMIKDLSINDARELGKIIQEKSDKHDIVYQLKNHKCPNPECGKDLGEIPVDIEKLLFFNMLQ